MTNPRPGHDEVLLTAPGSRQLCNSLACARAGQVAEVIVTYGVLNDPGPGYHHGGALWRESCHKPVPMCAACWTSSRQVAAKCRPGLAVIDAIAAPVAPLTCGDRS